jgi:hypothetical protein
MNIDGHRGDEESKEIDIGPTKQIFKKLAKKTKLSSIGKLCFYHDNMTLLSSHKI